MYLLYLVRYPYDYTYSVNLELCAYYVRIYSINYNYDKLLFY